MKARLPVIHHVGGRDRFVVKWDNRQSVQRSIGPLKTTPREILGMGCFMQRNRRHIAVQMDGIGKGIEVVATKQSPRHDRFAQNAERSKRISPRPSDASILREPAEIIKGAILIQPNLDVLQVVLFEVPREYLLGLGRDRMVLDPAVPKQQFGRDAKHPADSVDHGARFSSLDRQRIGL